MSDDVVVIRAEARPSLLAVVADLVRHRETIQALTLRSIKLRYRQAVFGVAWAVVQPACYLLIFSLVFGRVARLDGGDGVPYSAFVLTALVPWQLASNGITIGSQAIILDAALLRKVYFPREGPVIGAVGTALVDFGISMGLALCIAPFLGAHEGVWLLLLPVAVLPLLLLVTALTLLLAAVNVYFRDVRYFVALFVQLWMFCSPVAYPLTRIPSALRIPYAFVNPVVGPLDAMRHLVAAGTAPDWSVLGASTLATVLIAYGCLRAFHRLAPNFADVI